MSEREKIGPMADGFKSWCCGLSQVGTRRLSDEEARHLVVAIAQARRRHLGYRWFIRIAIVAMMVGWVLFSMNMPPQATGKMIAGFVMASIGALFLIAGVAGALGEVLFGFHPISRVVFGLALAMAGTTVGFGIESEVTEAATAVCGIFIILGGAAMFVLRNVAVRRSVMLAEKAARDLACGRVLQFAGQIEADSDAGEDDDISDDDAPLALPDFEHHTLDVLPSSGVIVRAEGELSNALTKVPIQKVATGGDSFEAPAHQESAPPARPGVAVLQRSLRSAEKAELEKLTKRVLRKAFLSSLGTFYFLAIVARGLDRVFTRWTDPGLSIHAFWATLLVVTVYLAYRLNQWRLLRRDLREAKVFVARAEGADLDFSLEETLSQSGVQWTQFGQPSAWRLG